LRASFWCFFAAGIECVVLAPGMHFGNISSGPLLCLCGCLPSWVVLSFLRALGMSFGVLLEQPGVLQVLLILGCAFSASGMHTRYFLSGHLLFWLPVVVLGWVGYCTPNDSTVVICFEFRSASLRGSLLAAALLGWFGHCLVGLGHCSVGLGIAQLVWALLGWSGHCLVGLGTAWLVWALLGWFEHCLVGLSTAWLV
jgi:hypothetical protein